MPITTNSPQSIEVEPNVDQYELGEWENAGVSRGEFEKALDAAEAAETKNPLGVTTGHYVDPNGPGGNPAGEAFYGSLAETFEKKAEKAQDKADSFESRAAELNDPARAEILYKRAEINEERAQHLAEEAGAYSEITDGLAEGNLDVEEIRQELPERLADRTAYYEERAADLTELSELVRENGNPAWADKLLARADRASGQAEFNSLNAERIAAFLETSETGGEPTVDEMPEAEAVDPWLSDAAVTTIQTELNGTEEFADSTVDSVRELSEGELGAIREVAIVLGADADDLAFLDFIVEEVGIRIVFVDNMVAQNNAFGAFGGEATIPESEGLGILLDSTFVDKNFDDGMSGENQVSAQGGEVFLHEATHILQSFGIVDFSGEVGDGDPMPELAAGESVNELDGEDQAVAVEMIAGDFIEDTAVLG